ncbi:hypothetical protein ACHAW6_010882 [Cyclotella cf. meneghiniana]
MSHILHYVGIQHLNLTFTYSGRITTGNSQHIITPKDKAVTTTAMLLIYHLLREAPTQSVKKSDGIFVPLNFAIDILKIVLEIIAMIIVLDISLGGLVEDETFREALVDYLRVCLGVVAPLSTLVLSTMIFCEILVPIDYTNEDDRL